MIVVKCNKNEFSYDVHSLVKAFYPAEDVKVFEEGEKSLSSDSHLPELFISFEENKIEAVVWENGEKKLCEENGLRWLCRGENRSSAGYMPPPADCISKVRRTGA